MNKRKISALILTSLIVTLENLQLCKLLKAKISPFFGSVYTFPVSPLHPSSMRLIKPHNFPALIAPLCRSTSGAVDTVRGSSNDSKVDRLPCTLPYSHPLLLVLTDSSGEEQECENKRSERQRHRAEKGEKRELFHIPLISVTKHLQIVSVKCGTKKIKQYSCYKNRKLSLNLHSNLL